MADRELDKTTIVDTLNDLIHTVEDSHEGYRHAAGRAESDDLKALFNDLAAQRGAIVRELQRSVAEVGGAPDIGGTVIGGAHRMLLGVREAVLGNDRATLLAEVQRAESECVRLYEEALAKELPPAIADGVSEQLARIRADLDRMAALRETIA
ncbi:PA2169 family four-helix-bundle protein [Azospirillum sp. RWY-5-1]|uniref:PA2169 family four-helix-bundle protein n=1 Tax=Azospirillum oleiclasticum TaxID=2735135 RepID=A0ABX2T727_9PROT|nr:PA2169 family four-helix-bundle protein [Azospirillum oleiclasticum]NYZ13198.1 PA2169 family four-helix-bundle protein [Azospirillum oleiclasticum]NYZ20129.1 PA2169 family four-helix-bundle protein [Azospirillum oleiclasticum]